jgi:DnaJ-class molecular chaperone
MSGQQTISKVIDCSSCKGKGHTITFNCVNKDPIKCIYCNGHGNMQICNACHGTGDHPHYTACLDDGCVQWCTGCNGNKYIKIT